MTVVISQVNAAKKSVLKYDGILITNAVQSFTRSQVVVSTILNCFVTIQAIYSVQVFVLAMIL